MSPFVSNLILNEDSNAGVAKNIESPVMVTFVIFIFSRALRIYKTVFPCSIFFSSINGTSLPSFRSNRTCQLLYNCLASCACIIATESRQRVSNIYFLILINSIHNFLKKETVNNEDNQNESHISL